jgi:tetratricopeptide (TPR) repeat protein
MDLEAIRARVFREGLGLMRESCRARTVVVIDDLDQADPALQDFVRRFSTESPAETATPLGFLVSRGARDPAAGAGQRGIECGPLAPNELRAALRTLLPDLEPRRAAGIVRSSRGHPALLVHLAQRAAAGGTSSNATDLAALLGERLQELAGPERRLLLFLGLLDGRAGSEKLLADLSGLSREELRAARQALLRRGLARGDSRGGLIVSEAIGRQCTHAASAQELRAAHARIGARLARTRGAAAAAALHLLRGGDVEAGLRIAREAMRDLRESGKVEQAIALGTEALAAAPGADDQALFSEELGDLHEKSGRFDEAGAHYGRALASPRGLPALARLRLLRKRGGIQLRAGRNDEARADFAEALGLVEPAGQGDPAGAANEHLHLLHELAALHLFLGEFGHATTFAYRGRELLGSLAAARLAPEARALHDFNLRSIAGHVFLRQFEYDRAAEEFQRSLKISERMGALSSTALILNNLGVSF